MGRPRNIWDSLERNPPDRTTPVRPATAPWPSPRPVDDRRVGTMGDIRTHQADSDD